jgi:hypothetical protein
MAEDMMYRGVEAWERARDDNATSVEQCRAALIAMLEDEALIDQLVTTAEVHRSDVCAVIDGLKRMAQGVSVVRSDMREKD